MPEAEELPTDWWTIADTARYLGVATSTVRSLASRQLMPAPDRRFGRTSLWRPRTIIKWNEKRPRKGRSPDQPDELPN